MIGFVKVYFYFLDLSFHIYTIQIIELHCMVFSKYSQEAIVPDIYKCIINVNNDYRASQGALVVKNLSANSRDARDSGLGQEEDPLEKTTATHSSILAWRIPWTEEPGGL